MKTYLVTLAISLFAITFSNAQTNIPPPSTPGPLGTGSWILFTSGATNYTSIQENWGVNLIGQSDHPVKVYNASLLIGYPSAGEFYGMNNAYINGVVGVGISDTKGYKFAVNGNAIATAMTVKLNADWPDYVFKPAFRLPSLPQVESYIEQHQHLPDMPTAAQVAKDGINLGKMNKLLLQKVEELTLYLIDQNNKWMHSKRKLMN